MPGRPPSGLTERLRLLQLETLYDLALALNNQRPEQELVDELLQRVCAVLDPAAAMAVTRSTHGGVLALASVGWAQRPPSGQVFEEPVWRDLLVQGVSVVRQDGELAGRSFRSLLATPISSRGVFLGYLAMLDKEERGGQPADFTEEDRRFLESVAALAGVALEGTRQMAELQTERQRLEEENKALKHDLLSAHDGRRIVAHAPSMRRVLEIVERVAPRSVNVLVLGESGTGKELVAKLLHTLSGREGPLVALNCAALPETLLESELFGIERGVATGVEERRGKFELADGGTLFLDEIGDLKLSMQVSLLRALQEREVVRVGGETPIPVRVRVVAATHQDLEARVEEGTFREDLYYRLKGVELVLPPLRERREDIPHLTRYFCEEFARREKVALPQIPSEVFAILLEYDFPGNVRELENVVEGAASMSEGPIDAAVMRSLLKPKGATLSAGPEPLELAAVERRHLARVLRLAEGNKSRAARLLGIDRRTLQRKGF